MEEKTPPNSPPPRIVLGLGNPGRQYEQTRHNAGFWFADLLARKYGAAFSFKRKFNAEAASIGGDEGAAGGDVFLFKPQTFMNLSGDSAQAAAKFYRAAAAQVLVVHDEVDLPPGAARLKSGGGDGGHRGVADISRRLGRDTWRLRIGVGRPPAGGVESYVLQPPAADEQQRIDAAMARALEVWAAVAAGRYEQAMLVLHTAAARPATAE